MNVERDAELHPAVAGRDTPTPTPDPPAVCDSCGNPESKDNEFVICNEHGRTYRYCEDCYAP